MTDRQRKGLMHWITFILAAAITFLFFVILAAQGLQVIQTGKIDIQLAYTAATAAMFINLTNNIAVKKASFLDTLTSYLESQNSGS